MSFTYLDKAERDRTMRTLKQYIAWSRGEDIDKSSIIEKWGPADKDLVPYLERLNSISDKFCTCASCSLGNEDKKHNATCPYITFYFTEYAINEFINELTHKLLFWGTHGEIEVAQRYLPTCGSDIIRPKIVVRWKNTTDMTAFLEFIIAILKAQYSEK